MENFSEILERGWNFAQTITIWDVVDVAIIAYLIYRLLTFVRKTSSATVIKGIVLLLAVMLLSSIMHLTVVNYLLQATFEMGVFAIIILFQPEIRRLLEQVGSSKLPGIFARREDDVALSMAITQTVIACTDMSRTKTGALIVFERDINLDAYINTGSIIAAEPAAELLKNIFYPKTPLHDGAVIIRNGRIAGAACMLPLSNNNRLSRELGMRHRAGIGMSERSDAVVVIVSEETGAISVAIGGMLKRHLAPDTFEILLRNELLPKREQQAWWKLGRGKNRTGEKE